MKDPSLWSRLASHDFAMTEPETDLATVVVRKTTLGTAQALDAVEDYRRFLYLAAACGPGIAPSHVVHAVWGVHAADSDAYAGTLGTVIRGVMPSFDASGLPRASGPVDAKTLALLRAEFGTAPNPRIWPDAHLRRRVLAMGWTMAAGFVVAVIGIIYMNSVMIASGTVVAVVAFAWTITYSPWSVGQRHDGSGDGGVVLAGESGGRGDGGKAGHDGSGDGAGGGDGGGGGGE